MSKPGTFQAILVVWLMVSAIYIANDMWKNGINVTYKMGVQAGFQQAIGEVITQSQNCQGFEIYIGEARAELLNVACLEAMAQQAAAQGEGGQEALIEDES